MKEGPEYDYKLGRFNWNVESGVLLVERSANGKLSRKKRVAVTMAAQDSCPASCPFFPVDGERMHPANVCYANNGQQGFQSQRLNRTGPHDPARLAQTEADMIREARGDVPLRMHIVGDSKTELGTSILAQAAEEYRGKHGQPVWTYTHVHHIPRATWKGVSVLRSCHTRGQLKRAARDGYASAIVVDAFPNGKRAWKEDGFTFVPCPNQTESKKTCDECKLCWQDRKLHATGTVIAFQIHGWKGSDKAVLAASIPEYNED